jgi:hypothetical protein
MTTHERTKPSNQTQKTMKTRGLLFLVLSLPLLVSGCSASKEETANQLNAHINAYKAAVPTPVNSPSLVKAVDTLLDNSDGNAFRKAITPNQERILKEIRSRAQEVIDCVPVVEKERQQLATGAKLDADQKESSYILRTKGADLEKVQRCDSVVNALDEEQRNKLRVKTELVKTMTAAAVSREDAERKAEERRKREAEQQKIAAEQAEKRAQESRVNAFLAKAGWDPNREGVRREMSQRMMAVVLKEAETNCENWLSGSCEREYGLRPSDFYLVRQKIGI